ncbi:MAG: thymidylate synthase, partial [Cyanobacteria bacterium J06641_5]
DFYFPEPNYLPTSREFLGEYIAQMLADAPIREGVKYTYGQRLRSWFGRDQIQQAIAKLSTDLDSARAVMSLWDVADYDSNNPPCLNHLWVRVTEPADNSKAPKALSLTATFRSNDMFSAWPANAMGLRALQQHLCEEIARRSGQEIALGPLMTSSQSAHIYDDCWDNADRLIAKQYARICKQRDYDDPCGSFAIELRDGEIVIEHLTPGTGEVVNCYSGRSAMKLYQQIAADCPGLQVEHALYVGTELQKAETALTCSQPEAYQQDRPFKLTNPAATPKTQVV